MKLCFHALPEELRAGLDRAAPLLALNEAPDGLAVAVERQGAPGLAVSKTGDRALIRYHHRVEFFRALSLLVQRAGEAAFELTETCCFDRNGAMLDCSRNAVLTPDCVRDLLAKMALMGLNWAMLYTEDTYEIEGQPYFGYLRGRYTQEELRALDDAADELGIELIPCIQTLAHLECALRWPGLEQARDSHRNLMVGEEFTYALIERMIVAASAPFRSKRIHIGMDEAWELGLGNYLSTHGYKPCAELMAEHLRRVRAIVAKHGLDAMMWSDMHFYAASPARLLYDPDCVLTDEALSAAPDEIDLVYWDYYHEDEAHYEKLLKLHARFKARTVFAGGIWSWNGPVVDYRRTLATALPALSQCRAQNVREVLATAWGDDGAETNLTGILYGLQVYAEYGYTGGYDASKVAERFAVCAGASAQAFLDLSRLNALPGIAPPAGDVSNPLKNLLYEDPLLPIFEEDFRGVPAAEHFGQLIPLYERHARENPGYARLFAFHAHVARALYQKCRWRDHAAACVRARDGAQIARMPELAAEAIRALEALRLAWFELWHFTNKPFGFEVIDVRLGGLIARFGTAARRFEALRDGTIADIPELSETKLPYLRRPDGAYGMLNHWMPVVTPGHIGMR